MKWFLYLIGFVIILPILGGLVFFFAGYFYFGADSSRDSQCASGDLTKYKIGDCIQDSDSNTEINIIRGFFEKNMPPDTCGYALMVLVDEGNPSAENQEVESALKFTESIPKTAMLKPIGVMLKDKAMLEAKVMSETSVSKFKALHFKTKHKVKVYKKTFNQNSQIGWLDYNTYSNYIDNASRFQKVPCSHNRNKKH